MGPPLSVPAAASSAASETWEDIVVSLVKVGGGVVHGIDPLVRQRQ